ncbi:MAG: hypothetical protein GQ570_02725 [Helicobacteraceae bacterium]|nr:hypothetical protein [Helicobacteraceae bacterium]
MGLQKPNRFKRKTSAKQKLWNYMRRNRTFRVGDAVMILDLTAKYIKQILWQLENSNYVTLELQAKKYVDRIYKLSKDTGARSPSLINGKVYDYNTNKDVEIDKKVSTASTRRTQLLGAMTATMMSKKELKDAANIDIKIGGLKKYFSEFVRAGAMVRIKPVERRDGEILYRINMEKIDELLTNIQKSV